MLKLHNDLIIFPSTYFKNFLTKQFKMLNFLKIFEISKYSEKNSFRVTKYAKFYTEIV